MKKLNSQEVNEFIIKHGAKLTDRQIAQQLGTSISIIKNRRYKLGLYAPKKEYVMKAPKKLVEEDLKVSRLSGAKKVTDKKYREALKEIARLEGEVDEVFKVKRTIQTFRIKQTVSGESSEATPVILASDFHVEERVDPDTVSGLNEYNLDISKARATKFFQSIARLVVIFQKDTTIKRAIIGLLGDFISNTIHEELQEGNYLMPGDAAWTAQQYLTSGLKFLLQETNLEYIIVCHTGNHGRMTKKVHISTEAGNSLERYMYRNMAEYFEKEKRLKFIIAEGQHTYVDVYGLTVRFLHGHSIKFGGGVGGITIPVRKAIAQWNKARKADITCFGHFHQRLDGGDFVANGSLIGYNTFALAIKADYEPPAQQFFLISNFKGGRKEGVLPIRVD